MFVFVVIVPLVALAMELLLQRSLEKRVWHWVLLFFIIGFAHALGSRCVGCSNYDDYANIYEKQGELLDTLGLLGFYDLDANQTYEFIFYAIFKVVVTLLPKVYWLAGFAFLSMYLLYTALKSYLHPREILLILVLSSVGISTQMIRQYLSWSLLLLVLTTSSRRFYIGSILGSFFIHHSAVIFYAKYILAKYFKWKILAIGVLLYLCSNLIFDTILTLDYYSIQFLTSEVGLDPDVLSYNKLFIPRIVFLILVAIILVIHGRHSLILWFIIVSIVIFILTYSLPLFPVRFNLLLLSNSVGLCVIALLRHFKISRLSILYILALFMFYVKIYYLTNGDFHLWSRYNVWI